MTPLAMYTNPTRGVGWLAAVSAGPMASSIGNATVAPIARRKVRRGSAFLLINIVHLSRKDTTTDTKIWKVTTQGHDSGTRATGQDDDEASKVNCIHGLGGLRGWLFVTSFCDPHLEWLALHHCHD